MLNGLIHPKPFSDDPHASRATRSLLIIILNFVFTIIIFFNKKDLFFNNSKFIFVLFSIMNFIIYKSALSRSDGGHIKMASIFSIILLLIYFIFFLTKYISENKLINLKFINLFLIGTLFLLNLNSFKNIPSFYGNLKKFINFEKNEFIDNNYLNSINQISKYFVNEKCIQAYTYDLAIYYILDKPSCSKFFNIWVIGSKNNQLKYIEEIIEKKPKFILTGGKIGFWFFRFFVIHIFTHFLQKNIMFSMNRMIGKFLKKISSD